MGNKFYRLSFDAIGKTLETFILSQLEASQERQTAVLKKLSEQFGNHANVINSQSKQINALYQIHQQTDKSGLSSFLSIFPSVTEIKPTDEQ